jgi:hypothetical protein
MQAPTRNLESQDALTLAVAGPGAVTPADIAREYALPAGEILTPPATVQGLTFPEDAPRAHPTADTSTPQPPPGLVQFSPPSRAKRRRHLGRAGMLPGDEAARIKAAEEAALAKKRAKDKATAKMKKRQRSRA